MNPLFRDLLLIFHFLGLAMALGGNISMMTLGLAAKSLPQGERLKFAKTVMILGKVSSVGLALLIVTGLALLPNLWGVLKTNGLFHTKLLVVFGIVVVFGMIQMFMRKFKASEDPAALKKVQILGRINLVLGIGAAVLAVLVFH